MMVKMTDKIVVRSRLPIDVKAMLRTVLELDACLDDLRSQLREEEFQDLLRVIVDGHVLSCVKGFICEDD